MNRVLFVIIFVFCLCAQYQAFGTEYDHKDHLNATAEIYLSKTARDLVGSGQGQGGDGQLDQRIELSVRGLGHTLDKIEVEPESQKGRIWSTEPIGAQWLLLVGSRQGVIKTGEKGLQIRLHNTIETFELYLQNDGSIQMNGAYQIRLSFEGGYSVTSPLIVMP